MITKKCKLCNTIKPLEEFVKNRVVKSGYGNRCKKCHYKETYKSRAKKQSYYTKLGNSYRKTDIGKIKVSARQKVKTAIRSGKLFKKPCEVCGSIKSEAHHSDYNQPLNVNWLCSFHHKEWHRKNKIII